MSANYKIIFEANYAKYGQLHIGIKEINAENRPAAYDRFKQWAKGRYKTLRIIEIQELTD